VSIASPGHHTHEDLWALPADGNRYELVGGELFVTPAPRTRHQAVVVTVTVALKAWVDEHGGRVYAAPTDLRFADDTVLEPDVLALTAEHVGQVQERWVDAPADLVVEVSSPSTASHDLIRKRRVYERGGVAEYWYVDLDAEVVYVHRLEGGAYGDPVAFSAGGTADSTVLPGFTVDVDVLLEAR
jgi:Uma2 family endonuclease